jgi:ferredoxin
MKRGHAHNVSGAPGDGGRLHVDWSRCEGRGLCHELFSELVGRDEWGYPVLPGGNDASIPAEYREFAEEAITACPLAAMRWQHRF